jgi:hypothetical protein
MHRAVRVAVPIAATAVGVLAFAAPAQAHTLHYGDDASNWVSRITAIKPVGAVHARIGDDVQRLTVSLGNARQVIIEGYDEEPFVLLRPGGAWLNTRSGTDTPTPPQWHRVADTSSWTWHDTRTHWPGYTLPPPVETNPNQRQQVLDWQVGLRADGTSGAISGTLDWVPGPSGKSGAAIATAAFAALLALALVARRTAVISAALVALIAFDVAHSAGMVAGRVGSVGYRLAALPGHGVLPLMLWIFGLGTVVLLHRRREFALYAAAMLAALFCFTEALPSLAILWHSQAINSLPIALNRALVAVLTGFSAATVTATVVVIVRTGRHITPGGPA